jgi:hypothetical protein
MAPSRLSRWKRFFMWLDLRMGIFLTGSES